MASNRINHRTGMGSFNFDARGCRGAVVEVLGPIQAYRIRSPIFVGSCDLPGGR
jgi:hypothetical protein